MNQLTGRQQLYEVLKEYMTEEERQYWYYVVYPDKQEYAL